MESLITRLELFSCLCIGLGLRAIVSLHSYSGANKPPMFGDYEAQRHWQEITTNIPIRKWYTNSTANDLNYWGLDYPPLTAYHSYAMGVAAQQLNASFVELQTSRGIESVEHKSFMRLTVLLCDIIFYLPACALLVIALKQQFNMKHACVLSLLLLIVLYPGQILIDNGHFQYNNVSLAFAGVAIVAALKDYHCSAALFFTLALNYKQMELYHSLPFFFFLLQKCFTENRFTDKLKKFVKIAITVVVTQMLLVVPWLSSMADITSVVERMFPFKRGVFEDKVANIWCALNVVYKFKQKLSIPVMGLMCLFTTAAMAFPLNVHMFISRGKNAFLYCLTNTALVFFLCSYQVHEKSILLAAFPAFCLFASSQFETFWFLEITVFSMLPLLMKDQLVIAYLSLMVIFHMGMQLMGVYANFLSSKSKLYSYCYWLSQIVLFVLTIGALSGLQPNRFPDLWSLLISVVSCGHFVVFLLFGLHKQINAK